MDEIAIIKLDPSRWQEAKRLRLEALQQDPVAFRGSYEEEITLGDEVWKNRATAGSTQQNNITLYAECDGRLIGMMGATWSNSMKIKHIAVLFGVYVIESMRGKGVASRLLEATLSEVALIPQIEKVKLTVSAQSKAAIALYEKFGFEHIGTALKERRVNQQYYDEYLMEKHL